MSVFSKAIAGLTKAESFLVTVFTKGPQVAQTLAKMSGPVVAAFTAVFYDVMKTATAATSAAAAAKTGNIPMVFTFSATTLALVQQVVDDSKKGEKLVVADLKELGILPDDAPVAA